MSIRLDALLLAADVGGNLSFKQPKLLGKNRVKTFRCQALGCLKQFYNYSDMKDHMFSIRHKEQTPSITPRSPLTALKETVPFISVVPLAILAPAPMAAVDGASQLQIRPVKRSFSEAVSQLSSAPKNSISENTKKSISDNLISDNPILSPKTAGWVHVGEKRFDAEVEMDPVNFFSHNAYHDFVSAQKHFDEENATKAMLSCPDLTDPMMSHGNIASVSGIFVS